MNNWDIALLKDTALTESKALEFRLETFNTFNHAQFFGANSVDGNTNDSTFGQIISAMPPRLMQASSFEVSLLTAWLPDLSTLAPESGGGHRFPSFFHNQRYEN